jgi:arginine-tRNA-protein transferase
MYSWTDFPSYDPEYEQWEFGKLSALREIAFAQENGYPYYYMGQYSYVWTNFLNLWKLTLTFIGYYIHNCQKMRYKGTFRPQYILGKQVDHISFPRLSLGPAEWNSIFCFAP